MPQIGRNPTGSVTGRGFDEQPDRPAPSAVTGSLVGEGLRARRFNRSAPIEGDGALRAMRQLILACLLVAGVSLGGCAGTDVELKGGVFDVLGMNDIAAKRVEPKMANRPGLVIPPSTASLPAPGSQPQPQVAANGEAFPVNPEDARRTQAAQIVDQHKAFCDNARQRYEAGITPLLESSQWGTCHDSVLRNVTGRDLAGKKAVGAE